MNTQMYESYRTKMVEGERDIALCELNHLSEKIEELRALVLNSKDWTSSESQKIVDEIQRIING